MKAYILKIDTLISDEYAKACAASCDAVELDWEYFQGYQDMTGRAAWLETGIKMDFTSRHGKDPSKPTEKAECCSAGHAAIWKKIAEGDDDVAIVLEHDAIMLHPVTVDVPDGNIVVLGYKITDPALYDHKLAGPPTELILVNGHEGAHAYALTRQTAKILIDEIEAKGLLGCIDNAYFIPKQRKTKTPLLIASPTPAIGWIRESTIWNKPAVRNTPFIESFQKYYK